MTDRERKILDLATKYYSEKDLVHALRVANYTQEDLTTDHSYLDSLWIVGLCHDLLEDTDCPASELNCYLNSAEYKAIQILTHHKEDCSYEEYMLKIATSKNAFAKAVKRADMKDHLMLADTLTDKLKNKYYLTVKYIL